MFLSPSLQIATITVRTSSCVWRHTFLGGEKGIKGLRNCQSISRLNQPEIPILLLVQILVLYLTMKVRSNWFFSIRMLTLNVDSAFRLCSPALVCRRSHGRHPSPSSG